MLDTDAINSVIYELFSPLVDPSGSSFHTAPGLAIGYATQTAAGVVGLGTTCLRRGTVPNGGTFFGVGSITKVLTGLLLAKAEVEGNMRLDRSINSYLKDDFNLPHSVTPLQLVTHTSGLPDLPEEILSTSEEKKNGINYARQQLIDEMKANERARTTPDMQPNYSNLGFAILAMALQDRLGFRSFDSMTKALITNPLHMSSTGVRSHSFPAAAPGRELAMGYGWSGAILRPVDFPNLGVLAAAGGLISTGDDMVRFLRGFIGVKSTSLQRVFAEAMTPLHRFAGAEMAYGIRISRLRSGATLYGKGGKTAGYTSLILWMTEPRVGFVILANRGSFDRLHRAGLELMNRALSLSIE